ncbi:MAG: ChaN family lipoprotein [Desulfobacterales bacterium]|uniref:ChaN family lipoprotein n=1 Tax=Candidatus Desulfaltia bathyphila TaxID=2841697 RepID=A0A8J6N429_9BACT|nr:ChaN family lipoprotein [Candidatus Desulfaltia bathyphila]MBL7195224.1 ChaN family lipoprotein [Desulfobacterales bacterium]MBL7207174.1 ChaN family lipoprotein [Desulfobacterales bacterium]
MAPKKLLIEDLSRSFKEGDIINTKTGVPVSFEELIADLNMAKVIYIGEKHTDSAHHKIQLRVIKRLIDTHPELVIGMEAFDHSYQKILDMWSAGRLDEKGFLERTHWYANWKFDFELYKDLLAFIRERHIKLIGLNIPFHIPPKIAVGGIESLSGDEKKYLPKRIDTTNADHRAYVEDIFKKHKVKGRENFEHFYMVQCVWEETMAELIALYLKKRSKIVVLSGNGHIIRKFGIPDRAFDRTGATFRTLLLAPAGSKAELAFADYIWVTPQIKKHNMGHVNSRKMKAQSHHPAK